MGFKATLNLMTTQTFNCFHQILRAQDYCTQMELLEGRDHVVFTICGKVLHSTWPLEWPNTYTKQNSMIQSLLSYVVDQHLSTLII